MGLLNPVEMPGPVVRSVIFLRVIPVTGDQKGTAPHEKRAEGQGGVILRGRLPGHPVLHMSPTNRDRNSCETRPFFPMTAL